MISNQNLFDRYLRKIKSNKPFSILLFIGISVVAIGQFAEGINSITNFFDQTPPSVIWDIELPAYVITDTAFKTKEEASKRLVELRRQARTDEYFNKTFTKFAYFWIPDFKYLSNTKLYQVYIGPYRNRKNAYNALCDYKKRYNSNSYGILLSNKPGRDDFYCSE